MQLQRYTPVEVVQESCNQQQIENVSPFCVLEMWSLRSASLTESSTAASAWKMASHACVSPCTSNREPTFSWQSSWVLSLLSKEWDSALLCKWKATGWSTPTGAIESGECRTTWNSSSMIRAFWRLKFICKVRSINSQSIKIQWPKVNPFL